MTSRQGYSPTAPLYARIALRFAGAAYARGAVLPGMLSGKRYEMWLAGKATHAAPRKRAERPPPPQRKKRR